MERFVQSKFFNETERHVGEIELIDFDVSAFQKDFEVRKKDPMFDMYEIRSNIQFLNQSLASDQALNLT
jgi:hypothetical protein